jgi:hypothetical protein
MLVLHTHFYITITLFNGGSLQFIIRKYLWAYCASCYRQIGEVFLCVKFHSLRYYRKPNGLGFFLKPIWVPFFLFGSALSGPTGANLSSSDDI